MNKHGILRRYLMLRDFFGFFFFSSRRRHTRSLRDWSSDVCSSDLVVKDDSTAELRPVGIGQSHGDLVVVESGLKAGERVVVNGRSEERRVGKECRSRWWRYH